VTIQIVVADPSDVMLLGFQTVLKNYLAFEMAHMVRSSEEVLAVVQQKGLNVLVFNERLDPLLDMLALVEIIKRMSSIKQIVVGTLTDGLLVRDLFAAGVLGYLYLGDDLKDCLVPALKTVLSQRPYLSPTVNAEYLVAMQSPLRDWQLDTDARTVLRLLARGMHVSTIALEMKTSLRRIYWLRRKLRHRFGATTNEHLIRRAAAEGFLSRDE
jgi:DNA-binding NarL/FixJ family response regulator